MATLFFYFKKIIFCGAADHTNVKVLKKISILIICIAALNSCAWNEAFKF
jgi:hypothetical protein